ncbi:DUF3500 domain-containing protein [Actinoplanes sp. NPDC051851]|uniref:DUF3500 domain-containing protein n=1 Tax=Actinoplanes sp. NPDC051851 TaxID=3154753 RepID=UPI00341AC812
MVLLLARRLPLVATIALTLMLAGGCGTAIDQPSPAERDVPDATATATTPAARAYDGTDGPAGVLLATHAFLATLDDTGRAAVRGERTAANLEQWSDLPDRLFKRAGLRMDGLDEGQRAAAMAILRAGLSRDGYRQVLQITAADDLLARRTESDQEYGSGHYWIRILGSPSAGEIWTVQYGGHHLGINLTLRGDQMTMAPSFWGAQPAVFHALGEEIQPLREVTEKAYTLIGALREEQRDEARLDTRITDVMLGPQEDGRTLDPEGVRASTFSTRQRTLLADLLAAWIGALNAESAAEKIAEAKEDLGATTFAWSGGDEPGRPVYYRLQGPTFSIEFAHQAGKGRNGGGVGHVHAIYREPENDYGMSYS